MKEIYLNLELESNGRKTAVKAIIDTGFSDYLAVNQKICKILNIKTTGKTRIRLGNNMVAEAKICDLKIRLLDNPDLIEVNLEALILPDEEDILIGAALLEALAKEVEVNILLDYKNRNFELVV